ncbi:major facilitator superfamily domain-containing protein [Mycena galopus ATCC 62051]|nr:major facilitator superfamily domain-containing protein [Mycena galopus ATCC 62051]
MAEEFTTTAIVAAAVSDSVVSRLAAEDKIPWYHKPNLRGLYLVLPPTCIGVEMTSGYDSSMLNGLQAVDSWDTFYHSPRSTLLGVMSAAYSLGAIIALPAVPYVNDVLGRRMAIIFGSILMIIGAVLQTASQNFAIILADRRTLTPQRARPLGSLFNSCFFIGSIVAAGVTLGTFGMSSNWGWRIPSLLQIAPSLLQVAFISLLPKSPRWLISKGRHDEAMAILVKYHAEGDANSEFVKAEYAQIERTLELELETRRTSWKDFVSTPRRGVSRINFALTGWRLVNATFLALTVTKFRRRTMYLTCSISLLLIFTGWTVASARYVQTGSKPASKAVLAFIFICSPAYNLGYNALTYSYLVELFPFHTRAKGVTFFQVIFIYFLFPETAHLTLEELAFLYEGEEIRVEQGKRVKEEIQREAKSDDGSLDETAGK